ncbi:MAG: aminopeptidase N [Dermatophilaceae bacterium]
MPGKNLTRDEAAARAAELRVEDYLVELDLTTGPTTFRTTTTVHFTARTPGRATWIDFVGESVERVTLGGVDLDPAEIFRDSRIELPDLAADNALVVEATGRYTNSGEGMHRFVDPIDGEVYLYSQFEVPDARRVFAVFEQPDLKARFTFVVTAPEHWTVISNQPTPEPVPAGPGRATWTFAPTPRLSGYVTAVCAGPYDVVRDEALCRERVVPLAIYTRKTLTEHLDAPALFDLTKIGLRYFEDQFDTAYPFEKYDQIFVPEFNAGAMENAGCVTISEIYVFRGRAPEALVERRGVTVLHELAHMWFGDLVTMRWWDDLWLNESFAEWASSACQAEATHWTQAWTTFQSHEKGWAYQQDQQADTHPVYADMRDLHDITVNFDGITYAKGGSVLKQLVAYVGREAFVEGLTRYFRAHAFGNTTMADLFVQLEATSGRDLDDWAQRWLRTAGVNTLSVDVQTDGSGVVTAATLRQSAIPDHPTLRPHRLGIGGYDLRDGTFVRTAYHEIDVDGSETPLPQLVGARRPDLVLPNDEDLTYAKILLDPLSLELARDHPQAFADSLPRSLVTASLWEMLQEGTLPPSEFVNYLLACVPVERQPTALRTILATTKQIPSMLLATVNWYTPPQHRAATRARVLPVIRSAADAADPGSDAQAQLVTAYAALMQTPHEAAAIRDVLAGTGPFPGLTVDQDMRWGLLCALAVVGAATEQDIAAEVDRDPSVAGHERSLQARAALPTPEAKDWAFRLVFDADTQTNAAVEHLGKGFRRTNDAPRLLGPYVDRFHEQILEAFTSRSYAIGERLVKFLYPIDVADPTLRDRSRRWLQENPDAPSGLRRLIVEQLTFVEMAVAAQERDVAAGPPQGRDSGPRT